MLSDCAAVSLPYQQVDIGFMFEQKLTPDCGGFMQIFCALTQANGIVDCNAVASIGQPI
ncbi:hypothetical protein [Rouxiella badensis]|uniref:hypothetical protein n=1 Tax=Rouxiella badensis TaxID=1646377 RepID=UPI0017886AAD|nr:hypothetical protein [Rouxiella badensis]QOI55620.1 hypothetical protein H2866_22445 [Rouxiella badensis subsp. acadiensis]